MNIRLTFFHLALLAMPLAAEITYYYSSPQKALPGEVIIAQDFPWIEDYNYRYSFLRATGLESAKSMDTFMRFLANPQDDELYYQLCAFSDENTELMKFARSKEYCSDEDYEKTLPLQRLHALNKNNSLMLKLGRKELRKEFQLRLRDIQLNNESSRKQLQQLLIWIIQDDSLNFEELLVLEQMLKTWYAGAGSDIIYSALMRLQIQEFRGAKPVVISKKQAEQLAKSGNNYMMFLHAEKGLSNQVSRHMPAGLSRHMQMFYSMIWRDTNSALQLIKTEQNAGYRLLGLKPEALPDFLAFKKIEQQGVQRSSGTGVVTISTSGKRSSGTIWNVPDCAKTAFNVHSFNTPDEAEAQVRAQLAKLPKELKALAPRCLLALGNGATAWQPVQVSINGVSPDWPDASAVQLPLWRDELLGLPDNAPDTVQQAWETDMKALEKHFVSARNQGYAGILLAEALDECNRVRPGRSDLSIPIYPRIALHFEEDGVTVDFTGSYRICAEDDYLTSNPIVNEALCKVPQLLHRMTLQLALLEKGGHTEQLEQNCNRLARLLNRHNLWPLVICQRELRGFSTLALLKLFSHYEGESAPLFDYGEALGLRYEMRIARLGHEDELGQHLLHAAYISHALPATEEQRAEAIQSFLNIAKANAGNISSELTGTILMHLTRWGASAEVLEWKDIPMRYLCGNYSTVGLHLIRELLRCGQQDEARRMVNAMAEHAETDTTPAYREALALMAETPEEAARLRRDALLLAILYRRVDYDAYCAYLEGQAAYGTQYENMIKSELLHTGGQSAGITPELAMRFATEGKWEAAVFAYEYLLSEGLTAATPYGLIPDHAHICYYRACADICRSKLFSKPELAERALQQLKGTSAENVAHKLLALPVPQSEPPQPRAIPRETDLLAALPAREWKLRDGSSVTGVLISIHLGLVNGLRLRLPDGSACLIAENDLAESPAAYIREWEQANGMQEWQWTLMPGKNTYFSSTYGRLLKGVPDRHHPDQKEYLVGILLKDASVEFIPTAGMPETQHDKVMEHCNKAENMRTLPPAEN
ncbi:MAG: hypothetical protein IJ943_01865 [Akkermansia sp.]|nr:hypothetical protein [Akkermansia sp.]